MFFIHSSSRRFGLDALRSSFWAASLRSYTMQGQNFLERYQQGERDFPHIDLSGVNLSGANLRNVNLSGANLTGANLSWAQLSDARLTGANLHQVNLHNAVLNKADFNQSALSRVNLNKADLRWATFQDADLYWVEAIESDWSGANLQSAKLDQINWENAKLNNTVLVDAQLMEANLRRATLINANLTHASLREAQLENANLRDAILNGANLTAANLNAAYLRSAQLCQADLHRATLVGADLSEANCDRADLSRANLSSAYLLKASLRKADLLRAILQDTYLLRTDLSAANLRGADLRRADLSAAYLKDAILSEANLQDAYLLESYLIRTKLDRAQLTGCCIHSWHLEEVDLSEVECRYVFTQFNYTTKSPSDRYPATGELLPGELGRANTEDGLMVDVRFTQAANWEVLVFTLAQVQLESPDLQLMVKSYEFNAGDYVLRLSASRLLDTQRLSQRILQLYPIIFNRFVAQRQTILDLLEIKTNKDLKLDVVPRHPATPPPSAVVNQRRRMYQEVVNQIQRIIMSQSPEQFVESVQRLLEFLKQQNISTEEIQKKVIGQIIVKRAAQDEIFTKQLLQWEKSADEAARFSVVGEALRLAIALVLSEVKPH